MANTTLTQLPANIQGFYDRNLLDRAEALLVHDRYGQVRNLPKKSGTKINFRRYSNLSTATTPLTEGVTPSGSQLSVTDINATVAQYGDFVTLTDQVDMFGLDNTVAEATDILGYQAGQSIDEVYRDSVIPNLANAITIAASEAATVAGDTITVAKIKEAILTLKNQNAMKFSPMISSGTGVGSSAVRAAFWGIIHPDVVFDLEDLDGFISAENYASTKTLEEGEVGAVKDVRFVESTQAYINADGGASDVDTYHTAIFAKNAYGVVNVRGEKASAGVIVKPLGSAGSADPLDQRSTVGWKANVTAKILNDAYAVSIVSSSSQGANA
jgi:N4-gp56 family major capsid protein